MNKKRALSLAREWAQGHRCTLQDGEAAEYHAMFASMLEKSTPNELLTLEQLLDMIRMIMGNGLHIIARRRERGTHERRFSVYLF